MGTVSASIALTAGGLSVVNPCSFPLLPALLSSYLGADEERLPRAPTRVGQGLIVGGLVTLGCLGLFAAIGLPLALGLGALARAVPWLGLATGAALALSGVAALAGRTVRLPLRAQFHIRRERRLRGMVLFGVGYGAASLGCTLPIFLTLVGTAIGPGKIEVFLAYGVGMGVVLMALSVSVGLARQGVARWLRRIVPHVHRLAGLLLLTSGGYLTYYWARVRFGDSGALADDPIVGTASRYSGQLANFAERHGAPILAAAGGVVAVAIVTALWRLRRRPTPQSTHVPADTQELIHS